LSENVSNWNNITERLVEKMGGMPMNEILLPDGIEGGW